MSMSTYIPTNLPYVKTYPNPWAPHTYTPTTTLS